MVYVLTFNIASAKAVCKAHKEYRMLTKKADAASVRQFLHDRSATASVNGLYSRWIILQSVLHGEGIFKHIKKDDFYKI